MFALAPSKADQATLRYWARNRYKAHVNGVRYTNRAFSGGQEQKEILYKRTQIRLRPILMTEEQKSAVIKATGSSPFLEVKFVPVARGRAKSLTRKAKKV